jgi:hypothetical protein
LRASDSNQSAEKIDAYARIPRRVGVLRLRRRETMAAPQMIRCMPGSTNSAAAEDFVVRSPMVALSKT